MLFYSLFIAILPLSQTACPKFKNAPIVMSNSTSMELADSFLKLNWNFQSQEAANILIEIFIRYECFNTYPQTHVMPLHLLDLLKRLPSQYRPYIVAAALQVKNGTPENDFYFGQLCQPFIRRTQINCVQVSGSLRQTLQTNVCGVRSGQAGCHGD
ncbi:hypothetical protein EMCRGX_G018059 [Ephydatia muelleri]